MRVGLRQLSHSDTSIDGSGPPRSRAARRRAVINRSSEPMVSMSRMRGVYIGYMLRSATAATARPVLAPLILITRDLFRT
jgi:hypothetical protein